RFERLPQEVRPGDRVFLGDGEVELKVVAIGDGEIAAQVVEGGTLRENLGVHVPGARLSVAAITEKDVADLKFGLRLGVDYLALSFVRGAEDVQQLKEMLRERGVRLPVIAKLEKQEAIENLQEILAVADGVMVARGDLALEVSPERVPLLQKRIIREANQRGILAITATQMLESMVNRPRPTRAEASDVANAILDGTDAVMLSAETAAGRYPVQAVRMMARIAETVEAQPMPAHRGGERPGRGHARAMSRAACALAEDAGAAAIVVFTRSGYSAQLVSEERPTVPIFAFTSSEEVCRQLSLWWGVAPLLIEFPPTAEEMIARAEGYLLDRGLLKGGDTAVVARWSPLRARGWTNFVKIHRLGAGG
ncbi:MAG: pyruvate kinase, partial [Dehalococcoidia bacterium]